MTRITIDTAQVTQVGVQFQAKSNELAALHQQAKSLMNSLQGQFMGNRANRIFGDWESMQPSLLNAIETLEIAGNLLKKAAADFAATDGAA
ncbi:hypothetical protein D6779_09550 [Candidatus Parcubacteria bacterium]|nr:MAG: hypothetical protein D6779_09550 [Candidatus Parcubacteria bacterium]